MGFLAGALKELFPTFREGIRNAIHAFLTARKKRQHIFVLKAMATVFETEAKWPPPNALFEQFYIERQITAAMTQEAFAEKYPKASVAVGVANWRMKDVDSRKKLKRVAKKYALPLLDDPRRSEKIEQILHEMVEAGRLNFQPPNRWSIKV